MAWNGSSNVGDDVAAPRKDAKSRASGVGPCAKGLAAGIVVVIGAMVVAYVFLVRPRTSAPACVATVEEHKGIAEVTPAAVTNARRSVKAVKDAGIDPNARPTKPGECLNGYVMMSDGTLHKQTGVAHTLGETPDPSQIFDNRAENAIALLLTMQPGDVLVGSPDYEEYFTEEFLKSAVVPIVIKADDSEYVKELKQAVIKTKIELKRAYDSGEDIAKTMSATHEEFQRLEQYKLDVFGDALDYVEKEAGTSDDVDDYLTAANKLLESKGIAPIEDSTLMDIKLDFDKKMEELK